MDGTVAPSHHNPDKRLEGVSSSTSGTQQGTRNKGRFFGLTIKGRQCSATLQCNTESSIAKACLDKVVQAAALTALAIDALASLLQQRLLLR